MAEILLVCTGNVCRSPLGQAVLQAALPASVTVASAGTRALVGRPMEPDACAALACAGIPVPPFVARQLTAEQVSAASLILTGTREHRAAAATLVPRQAPRTFTIREFGRLLAAVPAAELRPHPAHGRLQLLVAAAAGQRGLVRPDDPAEDDLPDPYRQGRAAFDQTLATLQGALDPLVYGLCGPDRRPSRRTPPDK